MTDLFKDWKEKRFVVNRDSLIEEGYEFFVVLTDFSFWIKNSDKLTAWCDRNQCKWTGMVISIPNETTMSLFILSWS